MPSVWQLSCLQSRIRSLRFEIKRVKNKDHPYPEPEIVFNALLEVVDARQRLIKEAKDLFSTPGREWIRERLFSSVVKDLADVAYYFSFVDRVDSARIPFEILRSLSWLANQLLHEDCRSVVRLDPQYNYTIASFRHIFEKLGWNAEWAHAVPHGCDPDRTTVLVLGFPSADASSILMHALAAHELGHELMRPKSISDRIDLVRDDSLSAIRRENQDALQDYLVQRSRATGNEDDTDSEHAVDHFDSARPDRKTRVGGDAYEASRKSFELHLSSIVTNWLREVFADLVAARLVGPAFLAAFDRLVVANTRPYTTHPPAGLRRKLVRQYLLKEMPLVMADGVWKRLCDPYDKFEPPSDFFWRICCDVCIISLTGLTRVVETVHSPLKAIGSLELWIEQVYQHIENLAPPSAVLPSDPAVSDADKFWLLMFCTWNFRLNDQRFRAFAARFGWKDDESLAEEAIGNLLLHSLRSLELKYQWSQNPRG